MTSNTPLPLSQEALNQVAQDNEYDDDAGRRFARGILIGLLSLAVVIGIAVVIGVTLARVIPG